MAQRGFTLLELLIVCLLISISLALSVPALRTSFVGDQLAAGSRKVISLITSARSRAVRDGEPQYVFFEPTEQKIWYQSAKEQDALDEENEEGEKKKLHSGVILPEGIRIEEIRQAGGKDEHNPLEDGLWISKQGYMDKTFIRLSGDNNEDMYLIIMPFFFDIQVEEEFAGFD